MRESDTILMPTRTVMSEGLDSDLPPPTWTKLAAIADRRAAAVALARDRGITIAMGTDIGLTARMCPTPGVETGESFHCLSKPV
jgi:hypothetical protein